MASPIPGVAVSTAYGKRGPYWSCNANSDGGVHTGVDFACSSGTDILAPIAGDIRHRSYGSAFGSHQFAISPDDGEPFGAGEVFFAHTTSRLADGTRVEVGDKIADVGAEGNVSGPHLHMEYHADTKGQWSCSTHDDPQPVLDYEPGAPTGYLLGWDVSSNNAGDWQPKDSESFGWVKATEGRSYVNPDYAEQLGKGRDAGNVVGHYHWLNDGDVTAQVDWFIANADVLPGEMIACDWEDSSDPTTAQKDQWINAVKDAFPNNRVGLYCNRDWWINHDTTSFYGDYLWIANYTTASDPGIKADWLFWQFTSSPMDQNRGRFDSEDALRAWAVCDDPPAPAVPAWSAKPTVILDDPTPDPDRNVSYLQAVVRVAAMTDNDGRHWGARYVVAQDYANTGDLRFGIMHEDGSYQGEWMQVNDGGHGQTFHAYRSAAGNFYIWCGENPAYRYKWQKGQKVAKSSGTKMDYKGCRPVGSYEPWVGFRDATDTKETFYLFDRTDFTDGTNRTNPAKSVTINKRNDYTQQTWAVTDKRIYRLMGQTNDDPPNGNRLHILDVFDWSGKLLLDRWDLTAMAISTTSDEPEGLTFSGTPGDLLAGKREGSTDPTKRSYPLWTLTGLP